MVNPKLVFQQQCCRERSQDSVQNTAVENNSSKDRKSNSTRAHGLPRCSTHRELCTNVLSLSMSSLFQIPQLCKKNPPGRGVVTHFDHVTRYRPNKDNVYVLTVLIFDKHSLHSKSTRCQNRAPSSRLMATKSFACSEQMPATFRE